MGISGSATTTTRPITRARAISPQLNFAGGAVAEKSRLQLYAYYVRGS